MSGEFEIEGWDFVPAPATAEDELDRLAPLFRTPGWCPEWHRQLREGFEGVSLVVRTSCAAAPEDQDQPLLDRLAEMVVAWRDGRGGDLETTLRACIEAVDAHRGRRP